MFKLIRIIIESKIYFAAAMLAFLSYLAYGQNIPAEEIIINQYANKLGEVINADIDNDGDEDILIVSDNIYWLEKTPENNVEYKNRGPMIDSTDKDRDYNITTLDLENDGDLDLAVTYTGSKEILIYENEVINDQRFFSLRETLEQSDLYGMYYYRSVHSGDFDHDGFDDLISLGIQEDSETSTSLNSLSFITWHSSDSVDGFKKPVSLYSGNFVKQLEINDGNQDGFDDIIFTVFKESKNGLDIMKYQLNQSFSEPELILTTDYPINKFIIFDSDNDQDDDYLIEQLTYPVERYQDFFTPLASTRVDVFQNNPGSSFTSLLLKRANGTTFCFWDIGQIDGDETPEIMIIHPFSMSIYEYNVATNDFEKKYRDASFKPFRLASGYSLQFINCKIFDVDGDQISDIVLSYNDHLYFMKNNSVNDEIILADQDYISFESGNVSEFSFGFINNDNIPDLFLKTISSREEKVLTQLLYLGEMNGTELSFIGPKLLSDDRFVGSYELLDVDNDEFDELFIRETMPDHLFKEIKTVEGNSGFELESTLILLEDLSVRKSYLVDMDFDNRPDLLTLGGYNDMRYIKNISSEGEILFDEPRLIYENNAIDITLTLHEPFEDLNNDHFRDLQGLLGLAELAFCMPSGGPFGPTCFYNYTYTDFKLLSPFDDSISAIKKNEVDSSFEPNKLDNKLLSIPEFDDDSTFFQYDVDDNGTIDLLVASPTGKVSLFRDYDPNLFQGNLWIIH